MKKLIVGIFISFLVVVNVIGQIQIFGTYSENGSLVPDVNVFGYGPKIDSLGKFKMIYFALAEEKWAEGIVGVNYSPNNWLEFGLGVGIEQNLALYRITANIWMGNKKVSFFTWAEKGDGRDNYWYKSVLSYSLSKNFKTELIAWRFNGEGINFKKSFSSFSFWIFPAYDFEFKQKRLTVGVDIKI